MGKKRTPQTALNLTVSADSLKPVNQFPIYVPSKGRARTGTTSNLLRDSGLNFKIVIEPQDELAYKTEWDTDNLVVMDRNNGGMAYVRNFCKAHSTANGDSNHWQIDDNVRNFRIRLNGKNEKCSPIEVLGPIEEFCLAHKNIGRAGTIYSVFAFAAKEDISFNRLVSSCFTVKNSLPLNFRGDVIEDVDYCLQILNTLHCTALFTRLQIEKMPSGKLTGGCTEIEHNDTKRRLRVLGLHKYWPGKFNATYKNGRLKVMPSRIWSTFQQRPIPV